MSPIFNLQSVWNKEIPLLYWILNIHFKGISPNTKLIAVIYCFWNYAVMNLIYLKWYIDGDGIHVKSLFMSSFLALISYNHNDVGFFDSGIYNVSGKMYVRCQTWLLVVLSLGVKIDIIYYWRQGLCNH